MHAPQATHALTSSNGAVIDNVALSGCGNNAGAPGAGTPSFASKLAIPLVSAWVTPNGTPPPNTDRNKERRLIHMDSSRTLFHSANGSVSSFIGSRPRSSTNRVRSDTRSASVG
ncbi:MAG: hypothetical protein ACK5KM_10390, partial [Hyphomicrobiaceae bacterium]